MTDSSSDLPRPTAEQLSITQAASSQTASLMITAYAGCAKTTTLLMMARALPPVPALALAFNVKIKTELERKFPDNFMVKTLNGLGHSAWGRAIGRKLIVDSGKLGKLVTAYCRERELRGNDTWDDIRRLVSSAMSVGLVPKRFPQKSLVPNSLEDWAVLAEENWIDPKEDTVLGAETVLGQSINLAYSGTISFDDQIYMSAMFGGVFPRFPLVMVDEAQDLSPLNHIQIQRCASDRLIVVGDPKQAIYQFRGADSSSMSNLRKLRQDWLDLPLATTFRCPRSIVARQLSHAPGFTAWPTNPEGQVEHWEREWSWQELSALGNGAPPTVLCRNNAPLIALAFKLIRARIGCTMLGRDIGKNLVRFSKKILPNDELPTADCVLAVSNWISEETSKAEANSKPHLVAGITDRGECLLAVLESDGVKNAGDLRLALEDIFAREDGALLATGHRAKGLEWPCVLHLDPWRIPSRHAKRAAAEGRPAQLEQEMNLRYVIETRAKHTLVMAKLADMV